MALRRCNQRQECVTVQHYRKLRAMFLQGVFLSSATKKTAASCGFSGIRQNQFGMQLLKRISSFGAVTMTGRLRKLPESMYSVLMR